MTKEFHITEIKNLEEDIVRIDFRWIIKKGKVTDFAINLSLLEDDVKTDVYRVDTKHGYLHEQKFWISPRPIPLDMGNNLAFIKKKKEVFEKHEKWVELFKESRKRGDMGWTK